MSLTSNLANPLSNVSIYFEKNFDFYPTLGINNEIKNYKTKTPSIQKNYYWKESGHVIEYLAALYSGLEMKDLFPMKYYPVKDAFYSYAITFYMLKGFTEMKELISILFYLSQVEASIRTGEKTRKIKDPGDVFIKDMMNLFESIKDSSLFSEKKGFSYNPTFLLSSFVNGADADFIKEIDKERYLFDMKTTKFSEITDGMLKQLMGYVLLDYFDQHKLNGIGIYMPRQNITVKWKLDDVIKNCSNFKSLDEARDIFSKEIGAENILLDIKKHSLEMNLFIGLGDEDFH